MELCLQPKLVGREEELRQLESYLNKSQDCHGRTLDIYEKLKLEKRAEKVRTILHEMQKRSV